MGDHADDAVNATVGEFGWFSRPRSRAAQPQCKYCQTRAVRWSHVNGKWRLHDIGGGAHCCDDYRRATQRG